MSEQDQSTATTFKPKRWAQPITLYGAIIVEAKDQDEAHNRVHIVMDEVILHDTEIKGAILRIGDIEREDDAKELTDDR